MAEFIGPDALEHPLPVELDDSNAGTGFDRENSKFVDPESGRGYGPSASRLHKDAHTCRVSGDERSTAAGDVIRIRVDRDNARESEIQ